MKVGLRLPGSVAVALVVPFVLAGSQNAVASERHCTYTDDPAVYECGYDEPLRTQAELETEMAERRAAGAQAVRARAASAQAVAAALSPEAAIAQLLVPVDDVSALSAEALAIGLAMSADFPRYAEVVTSAVEAPATPEPSRLMLLEILSGNWQFPEAREAVEHVFATAPPSSASAAYAALALAEQGEDIAAELLDRYPGLAPAQRGVYLRALAATGSSDAVPFILQRLSATDDADALERTVAAEMLGELASADDADASSALMSTIATYGALEAGSTGPVPDDAVAMRAARALGRIGGAENIGLLLGVAADTDLTTDTRITALEALSDHISGDGPLAERLQRVAKGFAASGRGQSDRERFESMVERVLQ